MKDKLFNKNFTIMVVGQLISMFGNTLQRFALSLYILDVTGSAALFSLILSIAILPEIFLAPFGGAFADRFDKKKIMVALDTFSGLLLLVFAILLRGSNSGLILIGVLMCVLAVIQSIYDPAVRASLPIMVAPKNLSKANSVVSIIGAMTSLLGPVCAGFVYGFLGIEAVFMINIISFFVSAFMELFLYIEHTPAKMEGKLLPTFCADLKSTAHYLIYKKRSIFYILLLSGAINLFLTPIYTVGVPYVEKLIFGVSDQLYGISEGSVGLGMIIGALLVAPISKKLPFTKMHIHFIFLTMLVLGMGIATLPGIVAASGVSYVSYILWTVIGFLFSFILVNVNISFMTYLQMETPNEMMGKTMALTGALSTALMPIGQIIFGSLYEIFQAKLIIIYLLVAACTVIVTILMKKILFNLPSSTDSE